MVHRIEENTGELPDEMSLDAGYYSDANVEHLEEKKIDVYMPPCRLKHREYREAKPEPVTEASTTRERMKSKVLTEEGRAKYGLRKETCEAEWSLVCAAHNLLKLFRHGASARQAQEHAMTGQRTDALAFAA